MNEGLIISELIFAVIYTIAIMVVVALIKSKDGQLRKIMIYYFTAEAFVYIGSGVYFMHPEVMSINALRIFVCTPKAIGMLWLYRYLRNQKTK